MQYVQKNWQLQELLQWDGPWFSKLIKLLSFKRKALNFAVAIGESERWYKKTPLNVIAQSKYKLFKLSNNLKVLIVLEGIFPLWFLGIRTDFCFNLLIKNSVIFFVHNNILKSRMQFAVSTFYLNNLSLFPHSKQMIVDEK